MESGKTHLCALQGQRGIHEILSQYNSPQLSFTNLPKGHTQFQRSKTELPHCWIAIKKKIYIGGKLLKIQGVYRRIKEQDYLREGEALRPAGKLG